MLHPLTHLPYVTPQDVGIAVAPTPQRRAAAPATNDQAGAPRAAATAPPTKPASPAAATTEGVVEIPAPSRKDDEPLSFTLSLKEEGADPLMQHSPTPKHTQRGNAQESQPAPDPRPSTAPTTPTPIHAASDPASPRQGVVTMPDPLLVPDATAARLEPPQPTLHQSGPTAPTTSPDMASPFPEPLLAPTGATAAHFDATAPALSERAATQAEAEPTEVHVHIGRIEITAVRESNPSRPARRPRREPMSLDDYLAQRQRGRG